MSGMRGINFASDKRSSDTVWTVRPHAKNIAARAAWDHFAKMGEVTRLRLTAGEWIAEVDQCVQTARAAQFARS